MIYDFRFVGVYLSGWQIIIQKSSIINIKNYDNQAIICFPRKQDW